MAESNVLYESQRTAFSEDVPKDEIPVAADSDNVKEPEMQAEETAPLEVADQTDNDDPKSDCGVQNNASPLSFSQIWTKAILYMHKPVLAIVQVMTQFAARNPWPTIGLVTAASLALIIIGFATNFSVDVDENRLWTPFGSRAIQHMDWINDETSFSAVDRSASMFFHEDGKDVLGYRQVARIFEAVEGVRNLPLFEEVCSQDTYVDRYENKNTCELHCVTRFWNNSLALFEETPKTDEAVIEVISARSFPEGRPVGTDSLFGHAERNNVDDDLLTEAQLYFCRIELPDLDDETHMDLEKQILDYVLSLRSKYEDDPDGFAFRAEVAAARSFSDEFERAILKDLPLVPIVFIIMSVFTALYFARRHPVYSRSLLGVMAVVSILLSIMSGFGLLFCCGVPFTSMTQLLPFVLFGIGLDDAFIIMGSFSRTDPGQGNTLERIRLTMDDIGVPITLTSVTSTAAFSIGCLSSIPAVFWLCLYAFPSVAFVYLYQLTFFVACIVLDQRRIQSNKRDILICVTYKPKGKPEEPAADEQEDGDSDSSSESQIENERQKLFEGWMRAYAEVLLRPWVKAVVVAIFLSFAGLCAYSASQMTQEFSFTEVVPDDSYLIDVTGALENYASETIFSPSCYFRNVDQSNTTIQDQMVHYVDQMVAMEYISRPPNHFWVDDFRAFVNSSDIEDELFEAQMDAFLSNDVYFDLYREKIDRDESGRVIMSRVALFMDKVNEKDVNEQVDVLMEQREISLSQPVNQGADEFAFFTYEDAYNIWEFYAVAVDELILTTVIGIVVMSGIALFFVPHWTAVLFVFPTVSLLYVDLLGILQWGNVHINAVMYVCLVISIGLLVDFVLHMTIRYYECEGNRREKTIKMLETMGVSILVGGISTFLGTLPLAFSTSSIFYTVFLSFLALVVTGIGHSLVLLPVVLSTVGPEDEVPHSSNLSMSFRDTTARSMLADES